MAGARTRVLVEAALCIALAAVLNLIKVWHMPMGGSVSLEMLPIVVFALRRGVGPGIAIGALYGVIALIFEPEIFNWAQFLLDYPLAYGGVGAAGVFAPLMAGRGKSHVAWVASAGVVLGGTLRLAMHWLSGYVFFAAYAPAGQPAGLYSLLYNLTYMLPATALVAIAAAVVLPGLQRVTPVR